MNTKPCGPCYDADRVEPCAVCKQPIAVGDRVHSYLAFGDLQWTTVHHACDKGGRS